MNILIADDHAIVRAGLIFIIKSQFDVLHIYEAGDVDGIEQLLGQHTIDLIICDINMPGFDHAAIIATLKSHAPNVRILMFSAYSEDLYGLRYLKAGAHGYLQKESSEEEMVKAIKMVMAHRIYVSPSLQQHLINDTATQASHPLQNLSAREVDIARLITKGKSLKEISGLLQLHVSSVSTYKRRLFEKLNIDNVADLIAILNNDNAGNMGSTEA